MAHPPACSTRCAIVPPRESRHPDGFRVSPRKRSRVVVALVVCAGIVSAIACEAVAPRFKVPLPAAPAESLTVRPAPAPAESLTVSPPSASVESLTVSVLPVPAETLTVSQPVAPAELTLSAAPNVFSAASVQAAPQLEPSGAASEGITVWSSNDQRIAVVNQMGMVVGRALGATVVRRSRGDHFSLTSVQVVRPEASPIRIIAHRGFMRRFPENTLVAVKSAFDNGADGVEVDVRLDADAEPMVMHDETVDRTTNGHGAVSALTSAELASLNACIHWAGVSPCVVPRMTDVLHEAHGRGGVLLHLYGNYSVDDLRKLLLIVRSADMDRDAVFISFDYSVLLNLRQLDPVVALGLLTTAPPDPQLIDALGRTAPLLELQAAIADSTATRAYLLNGSQRRDDFGVWVAWDQALAQQAFALGFRTILADVPIDRAALSR